MTTANAVECLTHVVPPGGGLTDANVVTTTTDVWAPPKINGGGEIELYKIDSDGKTTQVPWEDYYVTGVRILKVSTSPMMEPYDCEVRNNLPYNVFHCEIENVVADSSTILSMNVTWIAKADIPAEHGLKMQMYLGEGSFSPWNILINPATTAKTTASWDIPPVIDLGDVTPGERTAGINLPGPSNGAGRIHISPMTSEEQQRPVLEFESLNWASVTEGDVEFPADGPGTRVRVYAPKFTAEGEHTQTGTVTLECP